MAQPNCSICGMPVERWSTNSEGWGHNPSPVAGLTPRDRCCNWCNAHVVIAVRLHIAGAFLRPEEV
jgi:hypothetical protein